MLYQMKVWDDVLLVSHKQFVGSSVIINPNPGKHHSLSGRDKGECLTKQRCNLFYPTQAGVQMRGKHKNDGVYLIFR